MMLGNLLRVSLSTFKSGSSLLRCQPVLNKTFSPAAVKLFHTTNITNQEIKEDRRTTALTIIKSLSNVRQSPLPALTLGLSGLIPFIAVPGYMVLSQNFCPTLAFAQVAYGASILSFLGGIRWGLSLHSGGPAEPNWYNLGYSVVPSLIAWTGLLLPHSLSVLTLMGGLGFVAYFDTVMPGYPDWFKALRFILSVVAILSLWTCLMCKYVWLDSKPKTVPVSVGDKE